MPQKASCPTSIFWKKGQSECTGQVKTHCWHQHALFSKLPPGLFLRLFHFRQTCSFSKKMQLSNSCLRANPTQPRTTGSASEGKRNRKTYAKRYSMPQRIFAGCVQHATTIFRTTSNWRNMRSLLLKLSLFLIDRFALQKIRNRCSEPHQAISSNTLDPKWQRCE